MPVEFLRTIWDNISMNIRSNSFATSVFAGVVAGLSLIAQECAAVQVDAVSGPVLKFQDGADTVVYIPSNATIHVSGEGKFDMLVVGGGGLGGGGAGPITRRVPQAVPEAAAL